MSDATAPDPLPLSDVPLFRGLPADVLAGLRARGVLRRVSAGSVVWLAGAEASGLWVLLAGRARAVRQRDGREVVVHRAVPGDTLGEIPLFDGGGYPATLLADTDATFLVVPRLALDEAMRREPALAWRLLAHLGARVRRLADRIEGQVAGSVEERLAAWLLRRDATGNRDFDLGMTQEALAAELGTVREVLSRALTDAVRDGLVERTGRARYRVLDRRALEARAGGT